MSATLDFSFDDDQIALRALADQILDDFATTERMNALEREPEWFDRDAWTALGAAGAARRRAARVGGRRRRRIPRHRGRARVGGPSRGDRSRCSPASWAARCRSPRSATTRQRARVRRRLRPTGEIVLSAALQEPGNDDPTAPSTTADLGIDGWRLTGTKHCVPAAHLAARLLVPGACRRGHGRVPRRPPGPRRHADPVHHDQTASRSTP